MIRYISAFSATFLLVMTAAWYWVSSHPMSYLDLEYPMWKAKSDMLDRCETGSMPVLGDSKTVASISPPDLGPGFVNLAVGGGSMFDLWWITKKIVACKTAPKAVFISMSLGRFLDFQYFWDRSVKFNTLGLSRSDFEEFRLLTRQYGENEVFGAPSPFDVDAHLKLLLYTSKFPAFFAGSLIESRIVGRRAANAGIYADVMRDKGWHYFGTAESNDYIEGYVYFKHFMPSALQAALFDEMLKLYQSRNIPVYFFSPAYKERDLQLLGATPRAEYEAFLAGYARRYQNFKAIGEPFVGLPLEDFGDPNHVNPRGKAAWSSHFVQLLDDNGIVH
jgi:hypothetical protein